MPLKDKLNNPMVGNFISLVFVQGINYILPLLSFPFLARTLGWERWGLVEFGYAFTLYFVSFTDFGFNLSGTKYIAQHRDEPDKINTFLNSALLSRLILGIVSFFIILTILFVFERFRVEQTFYLLYFGIVIGNIMFPLWFFQGMEKMKYITFFNVIAKSISLLPLFFFIKQPSHYIYVPACYSIGYIIAGVFSLYFIYFKSGFKWYIPPFQNIWFALKDSSTYFLSRASTTLNAQSITTVLGLVCGNTILAYYAAAQRLYQAYDQLVAPLTGVLFPHMAKTQDISFFKRILTKVIIINITLVIIALLLSNWIITIVYGTEVHQTTLIAFRILLVANLFSIPSMLIGYPLLAAMGHPKYTNWTVILTSCFHIGMLILFYFTNSISIVYVSILVVLSQFVLLTLRIVGVKKFNVLQKT